MGPETPVKIQLKNDFSELDRLALALEQFREAHELSEDVIYRIQLALDEIITNIIKYGFDDDSEHDIGVSIDLIEGDISAVIEDEGRPFNPLEAPEPDLNVPLEERQIGGLGIHLVRNMVDGAEYQRTEGKNVFTFRKKAR
jgi:anti-sigma regulatory factor (Ser/Thr protein kinase)